MITGSEIREIGAFVKPHGINGEITALFPRELEPDSLSCIVLDMDGIFVPFFIDEWRPKATDTILIKLEGVNDERHAKSFAGKTIYALRRETQDMEEDDEDGFYTADLIGFEVSDENGSPVGVVKDYDDQTENVLLLVHLHGGGTAYLPLAEELITDFDAEHKTISLNLPEGLIDL